MYNNNLTGILPAEIGNLTNLNTLILSNNNLSGNFSNANNLVNIIYLNINDNQLTDELDISNLTELRSFSFNNNLFSSIDIRSGNNINLSVFEASDNPNLTCILVDDSAYSTTNWTDIDATATFVETQAECSALGIDDVDISELISVYPNPTTGIINIINSSDKTVEKVAITNVLGKRIIETNVNKIDLSSLATGIYFVNLFTDDNNKVSYKIIIK